MSQRGTETFHLIVEQHTTEDPYQIITFKHLYTQAPGLLYHCCWFK